jgi:hypothetical protein
MGSKGKEEIAKLLHVPNLQLWQLFTDADQDLHQKGNKKGKDIEECDIFVFFVAIILKKSENF